MAAWHWPLTAGCSICSDHHMHSTLRSRPAAVTHPPGAVAPRTGLGIVLTAAACFAAGQAGFAFTGNETFFSPFCKSLNDSEIQ